MEFEQPGRVDDHEPVVITPDDAATEAIARRAGHELRHQRVVLDSDQLASLVAPRARHERQLSPEAHLFTIDGVLHGEKVAGALFAGEVMLIYAPSLALAQELANRGLRATIELLYEEYETRTTRVDDPVRAGTVSDGGGRRASPSAPGRELATMPKLKRIMAAEILGLPWRG